MWSNGTNKRSLDEIFSIAVIVFSDPRPATIAMNTSLEGEILYEGDSIADLWVGLYRGKEEHETCFEGPYFVEEGFRAQHHFEGVVVSRHDFL